jgi:lysozyme
VKLYDLIRRFEGLRLKPYADAVGVPTVGYGHTGPEVTLQSPPVTPAVAEALMREDAEKARLAALKLSPALAANDDRLSAAADFIFNLGTSRYRASTLRRKINAGEWLDAKDEIQRWVYAGGRKLPGLIVRRAAEAALL